MLHPKFPKDDKSPIHIIRDMHDMHVMALQVGRQVGAG